MRGEIKILIGFCKTFKGKKGDLFILPLKKRGESSIKKFYSPKGKKKGDGSNFSTSVLHRTWGAITLTEKGGKCVSLARKETL